MPLYVPVEIVEEGQEVEAQLDKAFLFVAHERAEDLSSVQQIVVVDYSVVLVRARTCSRYRPPKEH